MIESMDQFNKQMWELFSDKAFEEHELGGTGKPHETRAMSNTLEQLNARQLATQWTPDLELWLVQIDGQAVLILDETYVGFSIKGPKAIVDKIKLTFYRELED